MKKVYEAGTIKTYCFTCMEETTQKVTENILQEVEDFWCTECDCVRKPHINDLKNFTDTREFDVGQREKASEDSRWVSEAGYVYCKNCSLSIDHSLKRYEADYGECDNDCGYKWN